jgi:hypothetical protein
MRLHTRLIPPRSGLIFSDARLKHDFLLLETLGNGIKLYRYQYRWFETDYVGVVAQQVAGIVPEAVSKDADGYFRVDYRRLGLQLRTYQNWVNKGHAASAPLTA